MTDTDDDGTANLPYYCPSCGNEQPWVERGDDDDETIVCYACLTTPRGESKPLIDQSTDGVNFNKPPHEQSVRPRYKGAVEHGRAKQVVMYGAFGYDPLLAPLDAIRSHTRGR